jgi:hypothetical protein
MNVIFTPKVLDYFEDLVVILYQKEYFSFLESSKKYVDELVDDIKINLPVKSKKEAPQYFTDKYGKGLYYAVFPKSKRTKWYVFFRMYQIDDEPYYQVRYIANNHTVAQNF